VDVFVDPQWGIYSFLLSTMSSLLITHLVLAFHRGSRKTETNVDYISTNSMILEKPIPLFRSYFRNSCMGPLLITLLLIASTTLLVLGAIFPSFEFQFEGAAALVLSYLNQTTSNTYSLVSLGLALPDSTENPDSFGTRYLQVTYFIFALAIPLTHMLTMIGLWLIPLSRKVQRRVFVLTEVLNAWSAIDVFVVSILAAVLEIEQFAQFIIGDRCNLINEILKQHFDGVLKGNDKCFDVQTKLYTGCWLLFTSAIIYLISAFVVMRACHKALEEKSESDENISAARSVVETPPEVHRTFPEQSQNYYLVNE